MPTSNTKVLTARIGKDKYYSLLERAAARKMPLNAYINALLDDILKPIQKAERGTEIADAVPFTDCIVFEGLQGYKGGISLIPDEYKDKTVFCVYRDQSYYIHELSKDNVVSKGVKIEENGTFPKYPIKFSQGQFWQVKPNGISSVLKTRNEKMQIKWK